jgi:hypothetical protein
MRLPAVTNALMGPYVSHMIRLTEQGSSIPTSASQQATERPFHRSWLLTTHSVRSVLLSVVNANRPKAYEVLMDGQRNIEWRIPISIGD